MYDLVNLYLDVLAAIAAPSVDCHRVLALADGSRPNSPWPARRKLGRLVLVDPVGIKLGGREDARHRALLQHRSRGTEPARLA